MTAREDTRPPCDADGVRARPSWTDEPSGAVNCAPPVFAPFAFLAAEVPLPIATPPRRNAASTYAINFFMPIGVPSIFRARGTRDPTGKSVLSRVRLWCGRNPIPRSNQSRRPPRMHEKRAHFPFMHSIEALPQAQNEYTEKTMRPYWAHLHSHAVHSCETVEVFLSNDLLALMLN